MQIPFLSCSDLAVLEAFPQPHEGDWADLEEMAAAGALDLDRVLGAPVRYVGAGDQRVERLQALSGWRRSSVGPAVPTASSRGSAAVVKRRTRPVGGDRQA